MACDLEENKPLNDFELEKQRIGKYSTYKWGDVKWMNFFAIIGVHMFALYNLFYAYPMHRNISTYLFNSVVATLCGLGITGGAHRLWTHRSYKANTSVRVFLMLCFTMAGENSLYNWIRDHRVHHKFSETNADPHNSYRGFFFAHCGWLMLNKHPEVLKQGKKLDMTDILNDPVITFHEKLSKTGDKFCKRIFILVKHFLKMKIFMCFILPVIIPWMFWNEDIITAFAINMVRYVFILNSTWSVNSAAHLYGNRPYDKNINPAENWLVSLLSIGEGWHNYHHVFPWDYRTAELGIDSFTTSTIDFFANKGWVWDRKMASKVLIEKSVQKHGDGSWANTF